jgi:hypothetical protein
MVQNKKVRDVVRAAVLRSKSPYDLQGDLEVLDDQSMSCTPGRFQ